MRDFWKRHGSGLALAGGMAAIALGVWMIYPLPVSSLPEC